MRYSIAFAALAVAATAAPALNARAPILDDIANNLDVIDIETGNILSDLIDIVEQTGEGDSFQDKTSISGVSGHHKRSPILDDIANNLDVVDLETGDILSDLIDIVEQKGESDSFQDKTKISGGPHHKVKRGGFDGDNDKFWDDEPSHVSGGCNGEINISGGTTGSFNNIDSKKRHAPAKPAPKYKYDSEEEEAEFEINISGGTTNSFNNVDSKKTKRGERYDWDSDSDDEETRSEINISGGTTNSFNNIDSKKMMKRAISKLVARSPILDDILNNFDLIDLETGDILSDLIDIVEQSGEGDSFQDKTKITKSH